MSDLREDRCYYYRVKVTVGAPVSVRELYYYAPMIDEAREPVRDRAEALRLVREFTKIAVRGSKVFVGDSVINMENVISIETDLTSGDLPEYVG